MMEIMNRLVYEIWISDQYTHVLNHEGTIITCDGRVYPCFIPNRYSNVSGTMCTNTTTTECAAANAQMFTNVMTVWNANRVLLCHASITTESDLNSNMIVFTDESIYRIPKTCLTATSMSSAIETMPTRPINIHDLQPVRNHDRGHILSHRDERNHDRERDRLRQCAGERDREPVRVDERYDDRHRGRQEGHHLETNAVLLHVQRQDL